MRKLYNAWKEKKNNDDKKIFGIPMRYNAHTHTHARAHTHTHTHTQALISKIVSYMIIVSIMLVCSSTRKKTIFFLYYILILNTVQF